MSTLFFDPPETLTFTDQDDEAGVTVYTDGNHHEFHLDHTIGTLLIPWEVVDLSVMFDQWYRQQSSLIRPAEWGARFHEWALTKVHDWHSGLTVMCTDCCRPEWSEEAQWVGGASRQVCESCVGMYRICPRCDDLYADADFTWIDDEAQSVCESCRDDAYTWCDYCDGYYRDGNSDQHRHGREDCCTSPAKVFTVPNGGAPLANDTTVTVRVGKGIISPEGMRAIGEVIRAHWMQHLNNPDFDESDREYSNNLYALSYNFLTEVDPVWQTNRGNFPKRLSKYAHDTFSVTLPKELLAQVGNVGRGHTGGEDMLVAVTRELDLSPEEYCNEGSCWWGEYAASRCALKSNGGFALRTFHPDGWVDGRAWVMPMKLVEGVPIGISGWIAPTFETYDSNLYLLFNGYGSLEGWAGPRLWAGMTGLTYRGLGSLSISPMWINGSHGYVIAPEPVAQALCDKTIGLSLDEHANLYETETAAVVSEQMEKSDA